MFLSRPVLSLIESAINHALSSDAGVETHLLSLEDKTVCVWVTGLDIKILIGFNDTALSLLSGETKDPDLTVIGTPFALLNMLLNRAESTTGEVDFSGDVTVARNLRGLVSDFDYDWESLIATFFGGTVAHKASRAKSQLSANIDSMKNHMHRELSDYLVQESRLLVSAEEVARFCDDIDCLRDDTDRLLQRVEILTGKFAG